MLRGFYYTTIHAITLITLYRHSQKSVSKGIYYTETESYLLHRDRDLLHRDILKSQCQKPFTIVNIEIIIT